MEHEQYGKDVAYVVLDQKGNVLVDGTYNGFDDVVKQTFWVVLFIVAVGKNPFDVIHSCLFFRFFMSQEVNLLL